MNLSGDVVCDKCNHHLGRIESNVVFVCDRVIIKCNNCGALFNVITNTGFMRMLDKVVDKVR